MDYLADQFIVRNERHMHVFSQIYGKNQVGSRLADITCPTLILWGLEDKLVDVSVGEQFAKGIDGARYIAVVGAGHLPFLEKPSLVAGHLNGFLDAHGY
jgi:pimeloyl-ACP methyl ester carboxylesterase